MQPEVANFLRHGILWAVSQTEAVALSRPSCPSGSRREARTEAILRAALEQLAKVGYSAMSIEEVAASVGIAKTTVYRRYPTKLDLVRAALGQFLGEAFGEPPNTGSLRGDLILMGRQALQLTSSVIGQGLFRASLLHSVEPELEQMGKHFEFQRAERQRVVAVRAVARGELSSEADFVTVMELLSGALLLRAVVKREPVDEIEVARMVDVLLQGVSPTSPRHRTGSRR